MPLPEGIQFLRLGWWVIHAVAVLFVWSWAYRRGRADERRAWLAREMERGRRAS